MKQVKRALIPMYQRLATLAGGRRVELGPEGRNAVIMMSSDYGNIGDLAIRYAQERYLEANLPGYAVRSVPLRATYQTLRHLRGKLTHSDLIMITGGGNMGDMYPRAQFGRMFIARYLKDQRIVSFPQSIIYSSAEARGKSGRREARALSGHADFVLCAREERSHEEMRSMFSNRVLYAPDIVLSLVDEVRSLPLVERSGALLMLRGDAEKNMTDRDARSIELRLRARYASVMSRDNTVADEAIVAGAEADPFFAMLDDFRASKVVVTDRLHGMIFAVITGTPCVVLPNTNHKIRGTYDAWIKGRCPYVEFVDRYDDDALDEALDRATARGATDVYADLAFDFAELDDAVLSAAR